jgi:hypothetical protein
MEAGFVFSGRIRNHRKGANFATLQFMKKTLYELLGVAPDATADDIAAAYEKARAALEQSSQSDPNQAIILREAFQLLSNKQKRQVYDSSLAAKEAALEAAAAAPAVEGANSMRFVWIAGAALGLVLVSWALIKKSPHNEAHDNMPLTGVVAKPQAVVTVPIQTASHQLNAEELYAKVSASVARVNVNDEHGNLLGIGSAVVVGPNDVITNCHVAKMGPNLELNFRNEKVNASIATADEVYDLCLLHVSSLSAPAVATADMSAVRTGEAVYAIGSPQGLELTISEGIISSLRNVPDAGTVIQTSAAISPGSSGGGLFDNSGRLVGITTFQSKSGQNLNFAVPAEWIKTVSTRTGGGVGSITMEH